MKSIEDFILDKVNAIEETALESADLHAIASEVISTYKTQCKVFHAGGFDSPGYDIDCYVMTFLDTNGEIQGVSVDIERY